MGFKDRLMRRFYVDASTERFIQHNRKRWKRNPNVEKDSVIVVDMFDWNPNVYCFSYLANYLADKTNSSISGFKFERSISEGLGLPNRRVRKIYESFGTKPALSFAAGKKYHAEAKAFAKQAFEGLTCKKDLLSISFEGVTLGHYIYDTFLRTGHATIDIKDQRLLTFIYDAYVIYKVCKDYFSRKKIVALLTTHYVYSYYGIPVRIALDMGVPVFMVSNMDELVITEIDPVTSNNLKYDKYQQIFDRLPDEIKPACRAEARKVLEERLNGGVDYGIADNILEEGRTGLIGYGPFSRAPLMKVTGRPRVLIMLNDFFDAPHWYRWLLFDDFWEWIHFTLEKAAQTPFDWYVKPHPAGLKYNDVLFEGLKKRHPKINFLERNASNRQLVDEGLSAMFTVYGTAGHEFAYMGVPVVNAGDNPHITFDFNLHPTTVEEYVHYINNADKLKVNMDKSKVEEFFYVHYLLQNKRNDFDARCIDPEFAWFKLGSKVNDPLIFDSYIKTETALKDKKIWAYFDQYFSKYFPRQIKNNPSENFGERAAQTL